MARKEEREPRRLRRQLVVKARLAGQQHVGAGGELLHDAARARADVFLTGEMRFHDYLAAQSQGLALVLPGHYATERFAVEELAGRLQGQWKDVQVWASRRERDPVTWV